MERLEHIKVSIHLDIMFVNEIPFLVGLSILVGLCKITPLDTDRSSKEVETALQKYIDIYLQNNITVTYLVAD
jgi:hypothetical protein